MVGCMTSIERVSSGLPVGATVPPLPCSEAAPGVDPFVLLAQAHQAVAELQRAELSLLGGDWFVRFAQSCNELFAAVDAVNIGVADEVERRGHDRSAGFFSTRAWLQHHLRISGADGRGRMQVVRLFSLLPEWAEAAREGRVGVEQTRLMARVAANPRIVEAVVECADALLTDAMVESFDVFERRVRLFARAADADRARRDAESAHDRRNVSVRQLPDGSWRVSCRFGSLQGAEFNEMLAAFVDAEFQADWSEAKAEHGDEVDVTDLRRTEPQRRADALVNALAAGAHSPASSIGSVPTLNVIIDEATLELEITGGRHDPARFRDIECRTQNGDVIDFSEAAALALWGRIRRVVRDGSGAVIDLGRAQRLFTGAAREAGMLLDDRCIWPGCSRPVRQCQADHSIGWKAHGATVPRNCGPMCGPHNRLKDRGAFTARRIAPGEWRIRNDVGDSVGLDPTGGW